MDLVTVSLKRIQAHKHCVYPIARNCKYHFLLDCHYAFLLMYTYLHAYRLQFQPDRRCTASWRTSLLPLDAKRKDNRSITEGHSSVDVNPSRSTFSADLIQILPIVYPSKKKFAK